MDFPASLSSHNYRTYAIHKHRPITLFPTIHPPSLDEVPSDRPVAVGLELLINLYKTIDDTFVSLWNRVHTHASPTWIAQLQTQLSDAVPAYLECTEAQAVEIRVTQQWLRATVWQLCVCQGLVNSVSNDASITFKYPIQISRDLLTMTQQFSQPAMEVHGAGLVSAAIHSSLQPYPPFHSRCKTSGPLSVLRSDLVIPVTGCMSTDPLATSISDVRFLGH
jgi:hypothetical protein